MSTFEHIIVESQGAVGLIKLNRPKMLNALSFGVFREIAAAVDDLEADDAIGCIVVTGSEKAFAAGADIKEMQPKSFIDMFSEDFAAIGGDRIARCRKPTIAAVAGYALGGGCELAMMCDFIIAADTAKFGQPEITLGTIPGIGGTQRLTRAIGKSKAMDLCLTGRMMDAAEAERSGLVSRIVPADRLMDETMAAAEKIAAMSRRRGGDGQGSSQPRLRDHAGRRHERGAQSIPRDLRAGRPLRGHGRVHREAQAGEQEPIAPSSRRRPGRHRDQARLCSRAALTSAR
ncbi:enoyl-CoA hydratase [Bradyrhizobium sp. USDA 4474]